MSEPTPAERDAWTGRAANDAQVQVSQARATIALLEAGNTVPFVARYRKEATGGLDEVQIRAVWDAWGAVVKLEERRAAILHSLTELGKLTPALQKSLAQASTLTALEDIYRPFKPKRRTRADKAREAGLEPLAKMLVTAPGEAPEAAAARFVNADAGFADVAATLAGARDIIAEQVSDAPHVRSWLRDMVAKRGVLEAKKSSKAPAGRTKFEEYYEYAEPVSRVASHRFHAVRRGEREDVLRVRVSVEPGVLDQLVGQLMRHFGGDSRRPWGAQLELAIRDGVGRIAFPAIQTEILGELRERADRDAVDVFARNLADLLLAAPFGSSAVVGIDPGLRTGSKCIAVDDRGRYRGQIVLHLAAGAQAEARAVAPFVEFVRKHAPAAVAVGNGTGGRETFDFARKALQEAGLDIPVVSVSESGASVYSASDIAREEFPDLDLTLRGAISIARRLQDPLAELVKVDPKSIGVGQYQHDVNQTLLQSQLDQTVESCVNKVGVDLNTASAPLLGYVAGIGPKMAKSIVGFRESKGAFSTRKQVLEVPGLGPKTFEQAAGFLRVRAGRDPLDASAVHPERYRLVRTMAKDAGLDVASLVGNTQAVAQLDWRRYVCEEDGVGEPTLRDIMEELARPGRDPRAQFEPPKFRDDVRELSDVREGMELEGVVTNVTKFGAFVDVGVHQDGLVHISKLSSRFVRDPHEIVGPGDSIRVRVLEVDLERRRLSLERLE